MCWKPRILDEELEGDISSTDMPINGSSGLIFADTKTTRRNRPPKGRPRSRVRARPAKRALKPLKHHIRITEDT